MLMRFHLYICGEFLYNVEFAIFVACNIIYRYVRTKESQ